MDHSKEIKFNYYNILAIPINHNIYSYIGKPNQPNLLFVDNGNMNSYVSQKIFIKDGVNKELVIENEPITNHNKPIFLHFPLVTNPTTQPNIIDVLIKEKKEVEINLNTLLNDDDNCKISQSMDKIDLYFQTPILIQSDLSTKNVTEGFNSFKVSESIFNYNEYLRDNTKEQGVIFEEWRDGKFTAMLTAFKPGGSDNYENHPKPSADDIVINENTTIEDLKKYYDSNTLRGTQDMDCQEIEVANNPEKSYIKVNPLEKEYKDTFIAIIVSFGLLIVVFIYIYFIMNKLKKAFQDGDDENLRKTAFGLHIIDIFIFYCLLGLGLGLAFDKPIIGVALISFAVFFGAVLSFLKLGAPDSINISPQPNTTEYIYKDKSNYIPLFGLVFALYNYINM